MPKRVTLTQNFTNNKYTWKNEGSHEVFLVSRIKEAPIPYYIHIENKRVSWERAAPFKDKEGKLCLEQRKWTEVLNEYFPSVLTRAKDMEDSEIKEG